MTYFQYRLNQLPPELRNTPAATMLKACRIYRDDTGNFLVLMPINGQADKLFMEPNYTTAREILRRAYFLNDSNFLMDVSSMVFDTADIEGG